MPRTASKEIQKPPAFLQKFQEDAEKQAAELQGSSRFVPMYIRAGFRKGAKGTREGLIEVVNPDIRDDKNNPQVTQVDSLDVVILAHTMTRNVRYKGKDGKVTTECFSVGPKKTGIGVGTLHNGPMACLECAERFPKGWERDVIEFGSDQVTRTSVTCSSRYQLTVLLPKDLWVNDEPTLAMVFLPMTSAYGVLIKEDEDAAERSKTLLSYPDRRDPEGHKGILHQLNGREWALGKKYGLEADKTPFNAIWTTIASEWLGDSTQPVPAFYIGDECDEDQLAVVDAVKAAGTAMMQDSIAQSLRDAYPRFAEKERARLADAAAHGRWEDFGDRARAALPMYLEAETVSAEEDLGPVDLPPTNPEVEARHGGAVAQKFVVAEEEFPPEEDLPF